MTLLSTTSITATNSVTVSNINQSYKQLLVEIWGNKGGNDGNGLKINSAVSPQAGQQFRYSTDGGLASNGPTGWSSLPIFNNQPSSGTSDGLTNYGYALFTNYSNTAQRKYAESGSVYVQNSSYNVGTRGSFFFNTTAAITSITLIAFSGSMDALGEIKIYGVN
jgi:hypothetical protein